MKSFWNGVIPALTTPFKPDGTVDHAFLAKHAGMMMDAGCTGIVALGSLGETSTLSAEEKRAVLETVVRGRKARRGGRGRGRALDRPCGGGGAHGGRGRMPRAHGASAVCLFQ